MIAPFHQLPVLKWALAAGASRVLKTGSQRETSELSLLSRQGRRDKDYSRLMAYLKGLTPSRLDSELRYMQVRHPQPLLPRGTNPCEAWRCTLCADVHQLHIHLVTPSLWCA